MRVTYNRELKIQKRFNELQIPTFIPMRYKLVTIDGHRHRKLVPAIHNLIFVHAQRTEITRLKHEDPIMLPLRYMTKRTIDARTTPTWKVLVIPDDQMINFMNVSNRVDDERIEYLEYSDYLDKPGQRVRIIDGDFAGTYGIIKRIKKNRQVVVMLTGVLAITLNSIPCSYIEKVADDNTPVSKFSHAQF